MLCLCLLGIAASAAADPRLRLLDRTIRELAADPEIPGLAVAAVLDGRLVLTRAVGQTMADGAAVGPDTRFRIASLSKGFAATAALMLAAEGKLALDMPAVQAAPHFRLKIAQERDRATLEHVLSHRLGLPPYAYDNLLEADIDVPRIFERLAKVDLVCPVGDCYVYQNVAFSLVEPAIEQAAGEPFEQAVRHTLLTPLGLRRSDYGLQALTADADWARPHRVRRGQLRQISPKPAYYRVPSAGGLNASLRDLVVWMQAQMGAAPDRLNPALLADLHAPRVHSGYQDRRVRWMRGRVTRTDYALGWRVYRYRDQRMIYHGGGVDGYRAFIAFLPDRQTGLVALWNSTSCKGWPLMPVFFDAVLGAPQGNWEGRPC